MMMVARLSVSISLGNGSDHAMHFATILREEFAIPTFQRYKLAGIRPNQVAGDLLDDTTSKVNQIFESNNVEINGPTTPVLNVPIITTGL